MTLMPRGIKKAASVNFRVVNVLKNLVVKLSGEGVMLIDYSAGRSSLSTRSNASGSGSQIVEYAMFPVSDFLGYQTSSLSRQVSRTPV